MSPSSTTDRALSGLNHKSLQKRQTRLSYHATHGHEHKTKGKFQPKWERSYVVEMVYLNRGYRLTNPNGDTLMMPINRKFLKKYYPWSCSTLYLWSKLHPDQSDGLGFGIQDARESAKEKSLYSMDHITIDRRWADRALLTLWCMISISKNDKARNVLALSLFSESS